MLAGYESLSAARAAIDAMDTADRLSDRSSSPATTRPSSPQRDARRMPDQ